MKEIQLEIEIAGTTVSLYIYYSFKKGAPESGPSYYSGGEPAEPDEVKIESIDWAYVHKGKTAPFNPLENGTLMKILVNDEWIYEQICMAAHAND